MHYFIYRTEINLKLRDVVAVIPYYSVFNLGCLYKGLCILFQDILYNVFQISRHVQMLNIVLHYCFVIIFLNRNISSSSLQFSSMSSGTAGPR